MLLFLNCMQIENYEISTVLILDHCCTGWKLCVLILYHLNDLPPCVLGLHRFFFSTAQIMLPVAVLAKLQRSRNRENDYIFRYIQLNC